MKTNINNRKRTKEIFYIIPVILAVLIIIFIVITKIDANSEKEKVKLENKIENNTEKTIEINDKANNDIIADIKEENEIPKNEVKENEIIQKNEIKENETIPQNDVKEEISNSEKNREFGNDVAFIGDSRTQAFLMYTGLKDVNDYTNIGLMVDTAITKKFITNSKGEKITILEDLQNKNINTIYIMLGVNELGWVYSSMFIEQYEKLINKIQEVKPNCEIILESIIPVTKSRSDSDKTYNNQRIKEYNTLIKEMANRKNIKFIDLVPVLADGNGNLPEEASTDGIHLNKEYCLKWLECLKNN